MKRSFFSTLAGSFASILALTFVSLICGCGNNGETSETSPVPTDTSALSAASVQGAAESIPDSLEDGDDLEFKCIDGVTFSLSDLRGYVVMIDVWRTDCDPCIERFGFLNELLAEHGDDRFKMIGISLDLPDGDVLRRFVDRHRLPYPIVAGVGQFTLSPDLLGALPVTYIFDRNGKLQSRIIGSYEKEVYEEQIRLVSEMG
ncbi:MAG: TlpA disulfide reductase family protein [Candidatus Zixiibacteriota bacterium]